MERKLVTIRRVAEVWKHPGADSLDLIKVDGWQLVTGIGNFQPGDLCVYHEIDSFLPISHPAYADLTKTAVNWTDPQGVVRQGHRLKTIKLRGEVSQGYALKLELFPELHMNGGIHPEGSLLEHLKQTGKLFDYDLAEDFGVVKWEKIIPMGGVAKGSFPSHTPKTDQERIQNLFGKFGNRGETRRSEYTNAAGETIVVERPYEFCRDDDWEVTVKLDGSSMTVFSRDEEFGVCSRNNDLVEVTEGNAFWAVAHRLKLRERMAVLGRNLSIQGELAGPGIQGNPDKLKELGFYVFDIYDIDRSRKLSRDERLEVIEQINQKYLFNEGPEEYVVPELKEAPLVEIRKFDFATVEEVKAYAGGPGFTGQGKREGVVFKSIQNPDISFKVIDDAYAMKHDN